MVKLTDKDANYPSFSLMASKVKFLYWLPAVAFQSSGEQVGLPCGRTGFESRLSQFPVGGGTKRGPNVDPLVERALAFSAGLGALGAFWGPRMT